MPREDQGVGSSEPRSESWELPAPREVFDIAHDAFLSLDADGRILYANPRAEELFGYEGGQARGIDLVTLVAEDERELVGEALQSLTVGGFERQVKWHL